MQEHIYTPSKKKIFWKSFPVWVIAAMQIVANIIILPIVLLNGKYFGLILINIVLGSLAIPGVILFFNYLKFSINKKFIVRYNTITLTDSKAGKSIVINPADICNIELFEKGWKNRLPWSSFEYFRITDKNKQVILVTTFLMDITDLWMDTLARKIDSHKLIRKVSYYPILKAPEE